MRKLSFVAHGRGHCKRLWLILVGFFLIVSCTATSAQAKGRALVIGINDYIDPAISDLKYCVSDARLLAGALSSERGIFDSGDIRLLTDVAVGEENKPTRQNMIKAIQWLSEAEPDETILFYFSGHGVVVNHRQYLVNQDTDTADFESSAFSVEKNLNAIFDDPRQTRARQIVTIFDCCHSGSRQRFNMHDGAKVTRVVETNDEMTTQEGTLISSLMTGAQGRVTLASCDEEEKSYEDPERQQGIFTFFLYRGLQGEGDANHDGKIGVQELSLYVYEAVRRWAVENKKQQTPRFMANVAGDIILSTSPKSGNGWRVASQDQIGLQLFQPQWQPGATDDVFIINAQPGQAVNVVGLAESPNGVAEVLIDGHPLPVGSLGSRDLRVVEISKNDTPGKETQTRFTGIIQGTDKPSEVIITIRDATGATRQFRLRINLDLSAPTGNSTVAVIGLSKREIDEYEELRTLRVGQGLRQVLSRAMRDVKQVSLVEEKTEVLAGLVKRQWMQQEAAFDPATAVQAGKLMGAKYVLYGEVYDFAAPHENRGKLYIAIQVRLVSVETGRIWLGSGEADLKIKPDPGGDFDRSNLAAVSNQAIRTALSDLFKAGPLV